MTGNQNTPNDFTFTMVNMPNEYDTDELSEGKFTLNSKIIDH